MYSKADLAALLPYPSVDAHKYSRGKMVLIAGSQSYPGAACLCAYASQKIGAGYTEVFTDKHNKEIIVSYRPSLVVRSFDEFDPGHALSDHYSGSCVVGPGFDVADESMFEICRNAIVGIKAPLLLDGGALSLVASDDLKDLLLQRKNENYSTVLTPHDGEAARLSSALFEQSDNRLVLAQTLARSYGSHIVLKGSTTVVSDGDHTEELAPGSAALAKAGTGDVLAGMIGGLLAQGLSPFDACILGVVLHGMSGKYASQASSMISVCAEEVIDAIPLAIEKLNKEKTKAKEG